MEKVSVIVPVYNKEKYINECLRSILSQSYSNLEIIVVDDGSTDDSYSICTEYAARDCRIRLIKQSNSGPARARNAGIEIATGQYMVFVDADDYIASDYIENLTRHTAFDFIISGYLEVNGDNIVEQKSSTRQIYGKENFADEIFKADVFKFIAVPYLKLYKTRIISQNNIRFQNITVGEDTAFVFEYLKYCKNLIFIDYVGYYNNIIQGTLSRKKIENLWPMLQRVIDVGDDVFNYKYDRNWQFLYMRMIKICLVNATGSYRGFHDLCLQIKNNMDFSNLHLKWCQKWKDGILYILLQIIPSYLLFILIKNVKKYKSDIF